MPSKRATQAELIKRREEIQELILKGINTVTIQDDMAKKYETSKRAIAEDMRYVTKDWQDKAEESSQLMRNKYADRLEMLFKEALEKENIKTALDIQKEIHKLNGVYKENESADKMPDFVNIGRRSNLKVVDGSGDE